jgi:hypothetical protein
MCASSFKLGRGAHQGTHTHTHIQHTRPVMDKHHHLSFLSEGDLNLPCLGCHVAVGASRREGLEEGHVGAPKHKGMEDPADPGT